MTCACHRAADTFIRAPAQIMAPVFRETHQTQLTGFEGLHQARPAIRALPSRCLGRGGLASRVDCGEGSTAQLSNSLVEALPGSVSKSLTQVPHRNSTRMSGMGNRRLRPGSGSHALAPTAVRSRNRCCVFRRGKSANRGGQLNALRSAKDKRPTTAY